MVGAAGGLIALQGVGGVVGGLAAGGAGERSFFSN